MKLSFEYGEHGMAEALDTFAGTKVSEINKQKAFWFFLDRKERVEYLRMRTKITEFKIEDIEIGTGLEAKSGDTVVMHYTGTFDDGEKFDSSVDRGQPFEVVIGKGYVIAGWDKGVPGMKVGGKRKLYIPYTLAYGEEGAGDVIPPLADLIFDVELLDVK